MLVLYLTRMRALARIFLTAGVRATLLANTLAPAFCAKGDTFGSGGRRSTLTVGFSNNFGAHGNLSSLVKFDLVSRSLGLFLAEGTRQGYAR